MWRKRRHKFVVGVLRIIFKPYFKIRYRCKFDKKISFPEGALIVSNHVMTMDPLLIGCLFKENLYYMTSMDLFEHRVIGKALEFLVNPIPKEKSRKDDLNAIRNCCKVAKENGSICIFVEGNRTFTGEMVKFDDSIAKLAKLVKKPLVICNIEGGYGIEPRFSNKLRKGKMHVGVKKIYQPEELKAMSTQEIHKIIQNGINVDNYQYYNNYKSKKSAEYLERVVYKCPVCNELHTLYSIKDKVICKKCGLEVTYNNDLTFTANNDKFSFKYLKDWYHWQIEEIKKLEFTDSQLIYEENIELVNPRMYDKKLRIGEGTLKFYSDKLVFELNTGTLEFLISDIDAMTILGRKKMNFYHNNKTYQYFGDPRINMIKYLNMFYLLKNRLNNIDDDFMGF